MKHFLVLIFTTCIMCTEDSSYRLVVHQIITNGYSKRRCFEISADHMEGIKNTMHIDNPLNATYIAFLTRTKSVEVIKSSELDHNAIELLAQYIPAIITEFK